MHRRVWEPTRTFLSASLTPLFAFALLAAPSNLLAQSHVVSPADLKAELRSAAAERQARIDRIEGLLASETGQKAIESAKLDPVQVRRAVSLLSDQELAKLSAMADQSNFAGSSLTHEQITIIIVGAILIILVAILAT